MPDGFVVFDDVFVPARAGVPRRRDVERRGVRPLPRAVGAPRRHHGHGRQADELVGLAQLIAEANGLAGVSHIREKIDEMAIHATLLRAGLEAALAHAEATPEGYYYPNELYTNAAKYQGAARVRPHGPPPPRHRRRGRAHRPVDRRPGEPRDPRRRREVHGDRHRASAEDRLRLFHAIRDLTADAFGGWHLVTNLQSGGGLFAQRLVTRRHYDMERAKSIARHAAGID